jgi:predicted kinase
MPQYTLLIGPPGSGKSTAAKDYPGIVVSPDDLRDNQHLDVREAYRLAKAEVVKQLSAGQDVIFDATNANRDSRQEMIALGRPYAEKIVGVWVNTPLEECFARHRQRASMSDRYPSDNNEFYGTIEKYWNSINNDPPRLSEGYDELIVL